MFKYKPSELERRGPDIESDSEVNRDQSTRQTSALEPTLNPSGFHTPDEASLPMSPSLALTEQAVALGELQDYGYDEIQVIPC